MTDSVDRRPHARGVRGTAGSVRSYGTGITHLRVLCALLLVCLFSLPAKSSARIAVQAMSASPCSLVVFDDERYIALHPPLGDRRFATAETIEGTLKRVDRRRTAEALRRTAESPLTAREESLRTTYLARLRVAKSVAVYEIAQWGTTDQIAAVGNAWRDSLVEVLSTPSGLGPPVFKLVNSLTTSMVTVSSRLGADTLWFDTNQHIVRWGGDGPLSLGYDRIVGPVHNLIQRALAGGRWQGDRDVLGLDPYDTPPLLRDRPPHMPATTDGDPVFCLVRIGADGIVRELKAPAGKSLPNPAICRWLRGLRYSPALKGNRRVESWVPVGIRPPPIK